MIDALRGPRFARPGGAPEGPLTLRVSLTIGPPVLLGGSGR